MIRSARIVLLGILMYLSPRLFFLIGGRWDPELRADDQIADRVYVMRRRLWRSVGLIGVVVTLTLLFLMYSGYSVGGDGYWARVAAVVLALSATLGRGGWDIQTWKGQSVLERIDRGMYKLAQLGATVLLLFVLSI